MAVPTEERPESPRASVEPEEAPSTRQRILDVALELFIEQGYDGTSLREIAERLGLTKAALYYHFTSKEDILMALHLRLHAMGKEAIRRLQDEPFSLDLWESLLDELIDEMFAQRKIMLLHERNQAALEKLHSKEHEADHDDLQQRFRSLLADPSIPLEDRLRVACSFGAIFGGLFMPPDAFADADGEAFRHLLRQAAHAVIGPR